MTTFFTSDLHLGHTNIIGFCERPYASVQEMNEDLVRRWNDTVAPEDEVYIVGDLAMGKLDDSLTYVALLQGHKYLVPGNHDRMFGCEGEKYRKTAQRYFAVGIEMLLAEHFSTGYEGHQYDICHFPFKGDSREQYEDRYQDERPRDIGQRLIHGHIHGLWRKSGRMVDVGVDAWGGYPVPLEEVLNAFESDEDFIAPASWY